MRIIIYQERKWGLKMADLFHRVSIRKFKDEAVSNEDIGYILEAAMSAPSAKNQQPWEFYVVENREVLKQLGESSPFSAPAGKAISEDCYDRHQQMGF